MRVARVAFFTIFLSILMFAAVNVYADYDTTAPVVKSVRFDRTESIKPGVFKLIIDIEEEETGVKNWNLDLLEKNAAVEQNRINGAVLSKSHGVYNDIDTFIYPESPVFTGTMKQTFYILSNCPSGDFVPFIEIYDRQGNHETYGPEGYVGRYWKTCQSFKLDNSISIRDEFDVDFQSYITNPKITSKIQSMNNTCMINFDSINHVAKGEWFEAIKGKDKTIVFANEEKQWVFNGLDIKNACKDVDLNVNVSKTNGEQYGNNNDVILTEFADNGVLPGVARVRLKADYMEELYSFYNKVLLYYINGNNAYSEPSDVKKLIDNKGAWCEFYVNHNSKFVISSKPVKMKKANLLKVKGKTAVVKYKKIKKKSKIMSVSKVIKFINKGQGVKTYVKKGGNKKILIARKSGKVCIKKGLKRGTYKVIIKVKAAGNNYYKPTTKNVTFRVKVK